MGVPPSPAHGALLKIITEDALISRHPWDAKKVSAVTAALWPLSYEKGYVCL